MRRKALFVDPPSRRQRVVKTGIAAGVSGFNRRLGFERLEERAMLSVAQDIINQLDQSAFTTAIHAASSLPLVGDQFRQLEDFTTILQDSLQTIENATQNVNSGHIQLAIALPSISTSFTFDLGLDSFLQVSTTGGVSASITPTLDVAFDYQNGNVSLDKAHTNLDIGFGLALPNFQVTATLNGLLYAKVVDNQNDPTNFQGHLKIGFDANNELQPEFSGNAHVRLGLTLSFVDPALNASFNPTFRTNLELDWGFDTQSHELMVPHLALKNFSLDVDRFMHGFLGDIVTTVQKYTKRLQPFIDVFNTPVPILSAFDSSQTIGELILKGAGLNGEERDRFNFAIQIIKTVNSIDLSGNTGGALINFGDINLTGDATQAQGFGFDTSQLTTVIDDIFNNPALNDVQATLESVANYVGLTTDAGFKFQLLENPGPVIGAILSGQTETMFSYSTGRQHFDLAASVGVGVKDLLGIFLEAGIVFDAQLSIGYDTAGLIKVTQTHDPIDLLHGFYFDNSEDTTGPPVPNVPHPKKTGLYLQGFMELQATAIATLSGGLYGNVSVELASTDSTSHVHLDSMIENLGAGSQVFDFSGGLYAAGTLEIKVPGTNITAFEYELGRIDLLNFDPPPSLGLGLPTSVVDVTNQHTLLLDVSKMPAGSTVMVQPFHNYVHAGTTYSGDGIRVDYMNEIVLYVERKDDVSTNYYNLIGLNGPLPDRVTINIDDPFNVFATEGAPSPAPAQTNNGILLTGGRTAGLRFSEAANGTHPTVLLVGGNGSNALTGGTMMFGNFIPSDRIAQAKAHFGNVSGYDAAGAAYLNSAVDAAILPTDTSGISSSTMSGNRGGLMFGGRGTNSFIANGPGAYEMIGGPSYDTFSISPSFNGATATYLIDGGPNGNNQLVVQVRAGELADFENGTVADKYNPAHKALDIFSRAGKFATAHGITKVTGYGDKESEITLGDTSELSMTFDVKGSAKLKFGGSNAPDVLNVTPVHVSQGFLSPYGTRYHSLPRLLGPPSTSLDLSHNLADYSILFPGTSGYGYFLEDPKYVITRTFGSTNTTQVVPFQAGIDGEGQLVLDGRGASDEYRVKMGFGSFLDVTIDDSDETTQNSLVVDVREGIVLKDRATLTDTSLHLEYYTPAQPIFGIPNSNGERPFSLPESIVYTPTVYFDANTDITLYGQYLHTIINRPLAPQQATIITDTSSNQSVFTYSSVTLPQAFIVDRKATTLTVLDFSNLRPTLDVLANGGTLTIDESGNAAPRETVNIHANTGTLVIDSVRAYGFGVETYNIFGNTGDITIHNKNYSALGIFVVTGTNHVVNVLANNGTIDLHNEGSPEMINHFAEAVVNIGDNSSLANVHGDINLSSSNSRYDLSINDSNGLGNRPWTINYQQTLVGDLAINYAGVNSSATTSDFYSRYRAYAQPGAQVIADSDPPFYIRQFNGSVLPTWQLNFVSTQGARGGDSIDIPVSISGSPAGTVTYAATNLPPGVSINTNTGRLTGIIAPLAYLSAMPISTTISATADGFTRRRYFEWYLYSGIDIFVPQLNTTLVEGTSVDFDPITTANNFNRPVTVTVSDLPAGLTFDQGTGKITGTVAVGAAQGGPYHSQIHATDGFETFDYEFDWYITGITFAETPLRRLAYVGDSISFTVSASTVSGAPVDISVEGLPEGLSFNPATHVISGVVIATAAESRFFSTTVQAIQGIDSNSIQIEWIVMPIGAGNYYFITDPGTQFDRELDFVNFYINISNTLNLPYTFEASGLPPGVSMVDNDGNFRITGRIEEGAATASPYHVRISATDGFWSGEVLFDWTVTVPGTVYIYEYSPQFSLVGDTMDFPLAAESSLQEELTFSATGLPPGLAISPAGVITGTIARPTTLPGQYNVIVTATAASGSDTMSFLWYVLPEFSNVISLPHPSGNGFFTISSPEGTLLTASISDDAEVNLPSGVIFPFNFLVFQVTNFELGAHVDLTISGLDVSQIADYYKYGPTPDNSANHWYNFLFDSGTSTGFEIVGNDIVLHLVDGGRGDDDLAANGIIFDIGGPAVTTIVQPPALPGDYNLDGTVDANDYVVWRKTQNATGLTPYSGADGNGDGHIGPEDYSVWRAHFGQTLPQPGAGSGLGANTFTSTTDTEVGTAASASSIGSQPTTEIADSNGGEQKPNQRRNLPLVHDPAVPLVKSHFPASRTPVGAKPTLATNSRGDAPIAWLASYPDANDDLEYLAETNYSECESELRVDNVHFESVEQVFADFPTTTSRLLRTLLRK